MATAVDPPVTQGGAGTDEGAPRAYRALLVIIPGAIVVLCIGAVIRGRRRWDDPTMYFYELWDVGHPGIVNTVTAMGFVTTAVLCCVLAITQCFAPSLNRWWLLAAALFTVIAADDLLRLHNSVPAGDVLARVVYWSAFAFLIVRLRPLLTRIRGSRVLVAGFLLVAAGEVLDMITPARRRPFRFRRLAEVLEESVTCLGAWCFALAAMGFVSAFLGRAVRPGATPGA